MNRKILILTGLVFLFVVVTIVWYFYYAKPVASPSLAQTNDPFLGRGLPPRFQFIGGEEGEEQTSVTEVTQKPEDPLIRVWDKPATGHTFVTEEVLREETATTTQGTSTIEVKRTVRATTTVLLFVDRETGYLYGYSPENNSVFQITNTIISGVHDAYIFNGGKRIIMRYKGENDSVVGVIATIPNFTLNGTPSPLEKIEYLNASVASIAVSGDKKTASYAVKTETGSTIYTVAGGAPTPSGFSPFSEWVLSYGGQSLYATTKASSYAMGVTTEVPGFAVTIGERPGLMVNPSPNYLLASSWVRGGVTTFLVNKDGVRTLFLKTLASKCGWGRDDFLICATPTSFPTGSSDLPDSWFKGLVSFDDSIIFIDINTFEEWNFLTFPDEYGTFDVTSFSFSDDNNLIAFINKKNGELWLIKRQLLSFE